MTNRAQLARPLAVALRAVDDGVRLELSLSRHHGGGGEAATAAAAAAAAEGGGAAARRAIATTAEGPEAVEEQKKEQRRAPAPAAAAARAAPPTATDAAARPLRAARDAASALARTLAEEAAAAASGGGALSAAGSGDPALARLRGKTVLLVAGRASRGTLTYSLAQVLVSRGCARVVLACRDVGEGRSCLDAARRQHAGSVGISVGKRPRADAAAAPAGADEGAAAAAAAPELICERPVSLASVAEAEAYAAYLEEAVLGGGGGGGGSGGAPARLDAVVVDAPSLAPRRGALARRWYSPGGVAGLAQVRDCGDCAVSFALVGCDYLISLSISSQLNNCNTRSHTLSPTAARRRAAGAAAPPRAAPRGQQGARRRRRVAAAPPRRRALAARLCAQLGGRHRGPLPAGGSRGARV